MITRHGSLSGALLGILTFSLFAACSPPATYESAPDAMEGDTSDAYPEEEDAYPDDPFYHEPEDHAEEDHAGGEAHVHGAAELAVVLEENFVTITLDSPLANFGLSEASKIKSSDLETYADGLAELMGDARCDTVERSADRRRNGDHSAMILSIVLDCRRPGRLDGLMFTGFKTYPDFKTVDAVYLGEGEQSAATLTPQEPFLPF